MINNYECWNINGYTLEYYDDTHEYLVDGINVPSITQILKTKFGNKYSEVDENTLKIASIKGTNVHKAIEIYEKTGEELELVTYDKFGIEDSNTLNELYNYKFLKKKYKFEVLDNEVPVILFYNNVPIAAGRLDLVLKIIEEIKLGDIKRTSQLDKEYLGYQLNLYRIAYQQCYGTNIQGLVGLHLRDNKRKFVPIPINEEIVMDLIEGYLGGKQ